MPRIRKQSMSQHDPYVDPGEEVFSDDDLTVDFENPDAAALASSYEIGPNGDVIESSNENEPIVNGLADIDHRTNLADVLDEDYLNQIGEDIVKKVERDITERGPWRDRFERGLEMMGLVQSDVDDGAFPGASNVVHPLLVEAITHIWARTLGELFPSEGPAKSKVLGDQRQDRIDRGERVAEYINYEMTIADEDYINETSRLLWSVPLHGCAFRKTFRDPILDRNIGIFVPADDMIVPAEATGLKSASRFTHRMRKSPNDLRHLQIVGYYRDVELSTPQNEENPIQDLKNETQDVEPDGDDEDLEHEIFETCINLNVPGFEHVDENGEQTGLELPFIVTTDRSSRKVLAIYAGWKQGDPKYRRKLYFTKYSFVPGFGFYDFGLLHLIGGLQAAATGALRVLLDSAATASLSGGFISRNVSLKGETLVVSPGEWQPVDATSEDLAKAFFPIPVKEPSAALFQLLGMLVDGAQRFTSTTEIQTGGTDGKNVAVGTINKLIEQGEKVMSTIHRLHHSAVADELRLRFELCADYAPTDGYPYDVSGQERTVYAEDFQPGVEIVPVSDPNIFSSSQRLAIAQGVYEVATQNPDVVPRKTAIKRLFKAMRVPDVDELIPEDAAPQAYDPAGEIQALLLGKPVMVAPEQHHESHLKVLWSFMQNPEFGGNEQVQMQIGPNLIAVIGQHLAYQWATAARGMGAPVDYMDPQSGQVQPPQIPPEQLALMLAQMAPQLAAIPGLPSVEDQSKDDKAGELEIKREELALKQEEKAQQIALERERHQQQLAMKQEEHEFKKQELLAKTELKIREGQMKAQVAQAKAQQDMQLQAQQAEQQAVMSQQKMAMDQQAMQNEQAISQQRMTQEQQAMQQEGALREQEAAQDMRHREQEQALQAQRPNPGQDRNSHLR